MLTINNRTLIIGCLFAVCISNAQQGAPGTISTQPTVSSNQQTPAELETMLSAIQDQATATTSGQSSIPQLPSTVTDANVAVPAASAPSNTVVPASPVAPIGQPVPGAPINQAPTVTTSVQTAVPVPTTASVTTTTVPQQPVPVSTMAPAVVSGVPSRDNTVQVASSPSISTPPVAPAVVVNVAGTTSTTTPTISTTPQPTTTVQPAQQTTMPMSAAQMPTTPMPGMQTMPNMPSITPPLSVSVPSQPIQPPTPVVTEVTLEEIEPEPEIVGIDTMNLEEGQGNWLFKRIWWERALERYEKTHALVDQVWEYRMQYFLKRSELDRSVLDPFYLSIGLSQGELQEIMAEIANRLEMERQQEGMLDQKERLLSQELQVERASLQEIKTAVDVIMELDHAVDDALNRLLEQANKAREYEKESWGSFKQISQELSDAKARDLYYKMDMFMRNIKDIQRYLQQDFTVYFQETTSKLSTEIERIKTLIQSLKEKGIDLKKQSQQMFNGMPEEIEQQQPLSQEDEEEPEPRKTGILHTLYQGVLFVGNLLLYPFYAIYQSIFGSSRAVVEVDNEPNSVQE